MATNAVIASEVANLSLATTPINEGLKRSVSWYPNPVLLAAAPREVPQGSTNIKAQRLAALGAAAVATLAENSSSITATAIPTLTSASSTLINTYTSIGFSSESDLAQIPAVNLRGLMGEMAIEGLTDYMSDNATNGIRGLIEALSTSGTSGAALAWPAVRAGRLAIVDVIGNKGKLMLVVDNKGVTDLQNDLEASNSSAFASIAMSDYVKRLMGEGAIPDDLGFAFEYEGIAVFRTNLTGQLGVSGANTIGLLCLMPDAQGGRGMMDQVQVPFILAGRRMPSTRDDAIRVAEIRGLVGVARWNIPLAEDTTQYAFKSTWDVFQANGPAARGILYKTT